MKKLLVFSLLCLCLSQLFTTACHKNTEPPEIAEPTDSITPIDTISPIDTTIITPAGDSVHYRYIYLTETNTNLPIAHCKIALFTRFYAPFCSDPNFLLSDTIGTTDSTGKLVWKWDGQPLPASTFIGAGFGTEIRGLLIDVTGTPPKSIHLQKQNISYVKLHIDYRLDTLPESRIELLSIAPSVNCYAPQENQMFTLAALHPFDTTILLRNFASFSHGYKIRYLVDFSSYQTYTSSGLSMPLQIAFPAVDTGYVNIVIE